MRFLLIVCISLATIGLGQSELKSRAIDNFFCNELLNHQIFMEFNASNTYVSLANYFSHDSMALKGFAKKFDSDAKEEREHGLKLMDYVIKRGGRVCTPKTDRPINDATWSSFSVCKIIENVIEMEKVVYAHLLKVHKCARGEDTVADKTYCSNSNSENEMACSLTCQLKSENKNGEDPQLQDFIEGEYLKEQVDSIKNLADMLTRLERATKSTNCDGLGLYHFDKEL